MAMHNPAHPGMILKEYTSIMTITEMASRLGVTRVNLSRILNGKQGISAEMSVRLGILLGNAPDFWFRLQNQYDIWQAQNNSQFDYSEIQPITMPMMA
ncbi:XRE family transcriptional regulator (plasmid) [Moraxella bovoculi]|uniref:HigA family addiction module antitoxin n=1 Tax=Moraxella bovoculi TaxID=386891 RepID=UPI000624C9AE|nr:HigA family addiction module antitoxin [Moraxella bovoculi]AKG19908.1 XRE family transcriptional regulator [Moraxella bovoculi]